MLIWLIASTLIPIVVVLMLFLSAAKDFWSIITFRIDFSRLIGDLIHVLLIVGIGVISEFFALFMLIKDIL